MALVSEALRRAPVSRQELLRCLALSPLGRALSVAAPGPRERVGVAAPIRPEHGPESW